MKVLQLSSSLRHDESERGIYPISHALIKAGHESIIIGSAQAIASLLCVLCVMGQYITAYLCPKKLVGIDTHILSFVKSSNSISPISFTYILVRLLGCYIGQCIPFQMTSAPKLFQSLYGFYPVNSYSKALFHVDLLISASKSIDKHFNKIFEKVKSEKIDKSIKLPDIICVPRGVDVRKYPYRHHSSVHWLHQTFAQFPELEHKNGWFFQHRSVLNMVKNGSLIF